jgi:hypothetical protein
MWRNLRKWLLGWLNGGPHFVVGDPARPYLLRWYILPRNPWCCLYLHKFVRDDDDRALHDHPWASISLCLLGSYVEHLPEGKRTVRGGSITLRAATFRHRVELIDDKPAWTLFLTGKRVREWGFWCPKGFVVWTDFVDTNNVGNVGNVGRGCGEMA